MRVRAVFTVQVISPTGTVSAASFPTLIGSLEVASPLFHSVFGHIIPQAPPLTSAGGGVTSPHLIYQRLQLPAVQICAEFRRYERANAIKWLKSSGVISLILEIKIID